MPSSCASVPARSSWPSPATAATTLNRRPVDGRSVEVLAAELKAAAAGRTDTILIVSADALSTHQSVINVLDAARRAGLARLSFAAQTGEAKAAP